MCCVAYEHSKSQPYTYIYDLYACLHSVHIVIRSHYAKQANMAALALQLGLNFAFAAEVGPLSQQMAFC